MIWARSCLVALGEVLASIYGELDLARRLLAKANLPRTTLIRFDHSASQNWYNILEFANLLGAVDRLAELAAAENCGCLELKAIMEQARGELILDREVREVAALLALIVLETGIEPCEARTLYAACLPVRGSVELSFELPHPLFEVLRALVSHGQREPMFRFARHICCLHNGTTKQALEDELERVAPGWQNRCRETAPHKPSGAQNDSYALVQLGSLPQTPGTYFARASLVLDGRRVSRPLLHKENVRRESLDAIILELHQAIDARRGSIARDHICLEFCLPEELFAERLDQCQVRVPGLADSLPIGQLYPLVLRWDQRVTNRQLLADVEPRWSLLSAHGVLPPRIPRYHPDVALGPCAWVEPNRWDAGIVHVSVSREKDLVLCLLTHAPGGDLSRCALRGLLSGGVPAVLWSRVASVPTDQLENLVVGRAIRDLRAQVFNERRQHHSPLKEHLSLLWDNPNRKPLDRRLRDTGRRSAT